MSRWRTLLAAAVLFAAPLHAQQYGAYVAIHDGELFISEPVDPDTASTVHIYRQTGTGWEQTATLEAPAHDGPDYFGRVVAMDDRSLLAGGTTFANGSGGVWVFRPDGDGWMFDTMLRPGGLADGDSFGRFGRLYGDLFFASSLSHGETGTVWVFERDDSGAWTEQAAIRPDNPDERFFGWDLAYDGERLIVGSLVQVPQQGQQPGPSWLRGAAYVFSRDAGGGWRQEARLSLADGQAGDAGQPGNPRAGALGVGWYHGVALLGLPGRDGGTGAAYAFTRGASGEWAISDTLTAADGATAATGAWFGHQIRTVGDEVWVSAPGADYAGAVYRFRPDPAGAGFTLSSKIEPGRDKDTGDGFGHSMAVSGDLAVIGQPGDDGGLGSAVVFRNRGGEWTEESKLFIPGEPGLDPITGDEVRCGDSGKADQFPCSNIEIESFLPVSAIGGGRGIETNDVWGWTDPQTGREYALVGRTDGTSFIDITDPNAPVYLGNLPKTPGAITNAWRDIKVYRDHAFIVADGAGQHGMQVFDLTRLRDVSDPPAMFEPDALYDDIASAHNIVINEESGTAYAVGANSGGETCGGGLHMIDIHEPEHPTFLGCFQDTATGQARTGYTHDAQCVDYAGPDTEHAGREICFGSNETAISIADVTDKEHPVKLASASYPDVGYTHQGWLTEDQRYFFLDDEGDEMENEAAVEGDTTGTTKPMSGTRTLVWDVSDLDDPVLVKQYFGTTLTIDHNLYIKGDLMYQSNYVSGLRILDISDPENPKEVGYFDTVPWDESVVFDGSWSNYPFFESGTIVVSSIKEGVFFLKYRRPELVP